MGSVRSRIFSVLGLGLIALAGVPQSAQADAFEAYGLFGTTQLPTGADVFDALPDGRLVVLVNATLHVETNVGSGSFTSLGVLPGAPPMDFPAFLRASADGSKIAAGDGFNSVGVFAFPALTGSWFTATHFDAEWFSATRLAISGASGNVVTVLDTTSPNPGAPNNPTVVTNTGIAGGITFDVAGNLYTGTGFGTGPHQTGDVRGFLAAEWQPLLTGGTPLDFVVDGIPVVDVLSAAALGFDAEGNLHVGGGDFFGISDIGFVAMVRASAVAAALDGNGAANVNDPNEVRMLDPQPGLSSEFYAVTYRAADQKLLVQDFGASTVHIFGSFEPIPAASTISMLNGAVLLTAVGAFVARQRVRHSALAGDCAGRSRP